jgi:chemotaxis protein MotB
MAGKGGGAWKVAYADFVTAMMAFFLVMWIVAQNKPIREAVAKYFQDPFGGSSNAKGSSSILPPFKDGEPTGTIGPDQGGAGRKPGGAEDDKSSLRIDNENPTSRRPSLVVVHDGEQAAMGTLILFAEGSADLDAAAQLRLTHLAPLLAGKPNKIELRGHTTGRPLSEGSEFRDAWQLSYERCVVVLEFLVGQGLKPDQFRISQAASFEPQTLKVDAKSQQKNSSVEIIMLSEFIEELRGSRDERDERVSAGPEDAAETTAAAAP